MFKLDNKGWGYPDIFKILAIMLVAIMVCMMIYQKNFNNLFGMVDKEYSTEINKSVTNTTYGDLEYAIEKSAQRYMKNEKIKEDKEYIVTVKEMQNDNYLDKLIDPLDKDKKCSGYVTIINTEGNVNYTPYLKCSSYKTKGYISKYDD